MNAAMAITDEDLRLAMVADTFAEAFPMTAARVLVTADTRAWAMTAAGTMTGYATSVIACDAEAGIERELAAGETPDGRPGVSVLVFAFSRDALEKAVSNRVGQCVMTCPTTACYNGLPVGEKTIAVGGRLRYFGDGWQVSKQIGGRRYWRIPVMDGEFLCEETFGTVKGVAGGNLIVLGAEPTATLEATAAAVSAIRRECRDVILPFPGGIARSGSKVGSKYKGLRASTNTAFTPTLRGVVPTAMPPEARCAYEIVIDGLSLEAVERATAIGVGTAAAGAGVVAVTAGNYGGSLGPHHIRLLDVLARYAANPSGDGEEARS
jgi:formylmethanofuran--tetrahydromethanopterin N-formyltransferase